MHMCYKGIAVCLKEKKKEGKGKKNPPNMTVLSTLLQLLIWQAPSGRQTFYLFITPNLWRKVDTGGICALLVPVLNEVHNLWVSLQKRYLNVDKEGVGGQIFSLLSAVIHLDKYCIIRKTKLYYKTSFN